MVEWWQVILLGIVEGITEFLPISSTGHLLITADLIGFDARLRDTFTIFIQLGAVFAVLGYYARDLIAQAQGFRQDATVRRFWLGIVVAMVPAALAGLALRGWIKGVLFHSPALIATSLIVGGLVLIGVDRWPRPPAVTRDVTKISLRQALGIGVAQMVALVPGVSRSGASIVGGLLTGLDRPTATTFSFYLALPTLGAATLVDLISSLPDLGPDALGPLLLGAVVACGVAWVSIGWLLRYVAHHSFLLFGLYRIAAGLLIWGLLAAGVLR